MILECDKSTGAARKQYIGIVSVLDVLMHLAELEDKEDIQHQLSTSVSTIIGHCIEGLSLWTISPHTSVCEALQSMSRGIHRALVPIESQMEHTSGIELAETSPGYRMLTQTDLVRFLRAESRNLQAIVSRSVESLGAVQSNVFGVPADMSVADTLKCMSMGSLTAVAIVEPVAEIDTTPMLAIAKGRKLVGTFSASDLRGCSCEALREWSSLGVLEFVRNTRVARKYGFKGAVMEPAAISYGDIGGQQEIIITCHPSSQLEEVINKAVDGRVHRVWVIDTQGFLLGVVALSDILRVVRQSMEAMHKSISTSTIGNSPGEATITTQLST